MRQSVLVRAPPVGQTRRRPTAFVLAPDSPAGPLRLAVHPLSIFAQAKEMKGMRLASSFCLPSILCESRAVLEGKISVLCTSDNERADRRTHSSFTGAASHKAGT